MLQPAEEWAQTDFRRRGQWAVSSAGGACQPVRPLFGVIHSGRCIMRYPRQWPIKDCDLLVKRVPGLAGQPEDASGDEVSLTSVGAHPGSTQTRSSSALATAAPSATVWAVWTGQRRPHMGLSSCARPAAAVGGGTSRRPTRRSRRCAHQRCGGCGGPDWGAGRGRRRHVAAAGACCCRCPGLRMAYCPERVAGDRSALAPRRTR